MDGRWGVLRERPFRLFFIGHVTSLMGTTMVPVALTFAVLGQGGSAGDVGRVLTAETVPLVAFLLLGGVVADRLSRRAVMVGADVVRFAAQGLLAALLVAGTPPIWQFMVLAAVVGAGNAFFNPAMTGLIPQVASAGRLQQANAMMGLAYSVGAIVGPAAAGVIVATTDAGWAVAADAVTYGLSVVCLLRLPMPRTLPVAEPFVGQLREGWREFRSRTWLWAIVAQFGLFHLVVWPPFIVLGAVVADHSLGGAGAWGAILGASGAGALLGGLVMLRARPVHPLYVASWGAAAIALPLALLASSAPTAGIAAGAFASGIGLAVFGTLWDTTMQQQIPSALLSRVSAYDWLGSVALLPLGYVLVGPVANLLGISATLWLAAVWMVLSTAVVLAVPDVRRTTSRPPAPTAGTPVGVGAGSVGDQRG